MKASTLAELISPIHELFIKVAAPDFDSVGVQPERIFCHYRVAKTQEPKFSELMKRLLLLEDAFEMQSPLCVFVCRSVTLDEDEEIDMSEWSIQFQVNEYDRDNGELTKMVLAQVETILLELKSHLNE